jgi:hypothetical protein
VFANIVRTLRNIIRGGWCCYGRANDLVDDDDVAQLAGKVDELGRRHRCHGVCGALSEGSHGEVDMTAS